MGFEIFMKLLYVLSLFPKVLPTITDHRGVRFHDDLCAGQGQEHTNSPVRIDYFKVPAIAKSGATARMRCQYDLGNETLYAVKWYKNTKEFYRYVPKSEPQFKAFMKPGVAVDIVKSDRTSVWLTNIHRDSRGYYTCQVSGSEPFYFCVMATEYMEVEVNDSFAPAPIPAVSRGGSNTVPAEGPIVKFEPEQDSVSIGENVTLVCDSNERRKASSLSWYINGKMIPLPLVEQRVTLQNISGRITNTLILRFVIEPEMFETGRLVLKCVASQHAIETASTKEVTAVIDPTCHIANPCIDDLVDILKSEYASCYRLLVEYSLAYNLTNEKQRWDSVASKCKINKNEMTTSRYGNDANDMMMASVITMIICFVLLRIAVF